MASQPKIAVIGCGRGIALADEWQKQGLCQITAICDRDRAKAKMHAERLVKDGFSLPATHASVEEMLQRGGFDAAIIGTPDATHFALACTVMEKNIHCYIEKPMCLDTNDAQKIIEVWKKNRVIAFVGHEFRFFPPIRAVKNRISSGVIGKPRMAITLDYCGRMGCYWRRREWRTEARGTNTLTLQKGVHQLDIQAFLVDSRPETVYASGGMDHYGGEKDPALTCKTCLDAESCRYHTSKIIINGKPNTHMIRDGLCVFARNLDIGDNQTVVIDYQNGVRGSYTHCFFTPEYKFEHTIIGDLGKITVSMYWDDKMATIETSFIGGTERKRETVEIKNGDHGGSDFAIGQAFTQAVAQKQQAAPTPIDGFYAVATACAIDESERTKQPVKIVDHAAVPEK